MVFAFDAEFPGLLDTSAAVECLRSLPLSTRTVTPNVTPTTVNSCHFGAIPDTLGDEVDSVEKRKTLQILWKMQGFR